MKSEVNQKSKIDSLFKYSADIGPVVIVNWAEALKINYYKTLKDYLAFRRYTTESFFKIYGQEGVWVADDLLKNLKASFIFYPDPHALPADIEDIEIADIICSNIEEYIIGERTSFDPNEYDDANIDDIVKTIRSVDRKARLIMTLTSQPGLDVSQDDIDTICGIVDLSN